MREIRPYGSVRGVRRNPYPYRDTFLPMRSMAGFDFHRFSRRIPPQLAPIRSHRIAFTMLSGGESMVSYASQSPANRGRKRRQIESGIGPRISRIGITARIGGTSPQ